MHEDQVVAWGHKRLAWMFRMQTKYTLKSVRAQRKHDCDTAHKTQAWHDDRDDSASYRRNITAMVRSRQNNLTPWHSDTEQESSHEDGMTRGTTRTLRCSEGIHVEENVHHYACAITTASPLVLPYRHT